MSADSFPAHIDLLTPDTVAELRMRGAAFDHPRDYVNSLVGKYHDHRLYTGLFTLVSSMLGPTEQTADKRRISHLKKAFLAGNLLGAELVDVAGGEALLERSAVTSLEFPDISDELSEQEQLQEAASCLHENSLQVYEVATPLHSLVDAWGNKIVDRKHQSSLRAGIGMMLTLGEVAIVGLEYDALDAAANLDVIKWDEELANLATADDVRRIMDGTDN